MNRSTAVARIKRGLGFRTDLDDTIVTQLQESQRLLEQGRSLPYFLLQEDATLTVPAGSAEVALPSRFLREKQGEGLRFYNSDDLEYVFLEKVDIDVGNARFVDADEGAPRAYSLRKSTIKFYPPRDTSYDLTWSYYVGGELLTSDIENSWLATSPEILIGHAGAALASDLRDAEAKVLFDKMYSEAWANAFADGILRDEENNPTHLGERL